MSKNSPEFISPRAAAGFGASGKSEGQISPFPSSLHVSNGHSIDSASPVLDLFMQLPMQKLSKPSSENGQQESKIPDSQGSFYRLLRRQMLEATSRAELLKGIMLVENVVFELPDRKGAAPLQPVSESAIYPMAAEATMEMYRKEEEYSKMEKELRVEGKSGKEIGELFGVKEAFKPELKEYPEIAKHALKTLGINISIFDKADSEAKIRILNGRYVRAIKAVETGPEVARINLAMGIAASFYALPIKNRI